MLYSYDFIFISYDFNYNGGMKKEVMCITATEFKNNLGKYLELGEKQEILIMKNGRVRTRLVPATIDVEKTLDELQGILKGADFDLDDAKTEYFNKKYGYNF